MSFTYSHYQASAASLPIDYGLLSRYAGAHLGRPHEGTDDEEDEIGSQSSVIGSEASHGRRRYLQIERPRTIPTAVSFPKPFTESETAPLLGPHSPVPRIVEESDVANDEILEPGSFASYWEESKVLVRYTLPVYGTHLLEHSLVIASVISIGHLSTAALASSTLGSMTAIVTGYSILQGFASVLDTLLPSAWTSDQPQLVGLWAQRAMFVMGIALIPIASIWLNAEVILILLRQDPDIAQLSALYLRWAILGLPAYAFNQVSRRYFQSQGLFAVPTQIIVMVAPINVFLNYMLVWGPVSIRLGFIGAPIATAISFNLIALLSLAYGIFWVPRTAWYPLSRRIFTSLGILVQLGIAGIGQICSEWWSWELVYLAVSQLGPTSLATQSIVHVSATTAFMAPFSLGVASSVRIGNLLGERSASRARIAARTSFLVVLSIQVIPATIFLAFRKSWGYLFNNDPDVVSLVAKILPIVALYQILDGSYACCSGILRARGKQATGALINLSAYYVLGIPVGLWLAFRCGMKLVGLWIGLTVALLYCAIVGSWLCLRTDWEREVRKVEMRMEKERQESEGIRAAAGQVEQ